MFALGLFASGVVLWSASRDSSDDERELMYCIQILLAEYAHYVRIIWKFQEKLQCDRNFFVNFRMLNFKH